MSTAGDTERTWLELDEASPEQESFEQLAVASSVRLDVGALCFPAWFVFRSGGIYPLATHLFLDQCESLTAADVATVCRAFSSLQRLTIVALVIADDEDTFASCSTLPRVTQFSLEVYESMPTQGLVSIGAVTSLTDLNVKLHAACDASAGDVHKISVAWQSLRFLETFSFIQSTDSSLPFAAAAFAEWAHLRTVIVPRGVTDQMVMVLGAVAGRSLVRLDVGGSQLTDAGVLQLLGASVVLEDLTLRSCPQVLGRFAASRGPQQQDGLGDNRGVSIKHLSLHETGVRDHPVCEAGGPSWYEGLDAWRALQSLAIADGCEWNDAVQQAALTWLGDSAARHFSFTFETLNKRSCM